MIFFFDKLNKVLQSKVLLFTAVRIHIYDKSSLENKGEVLKFNHQSRSDLSNIELNLDPKRIGIKYSYFKITVLKSMYIFKWQVQKIEISDIVKPKIKEPILWVAVKFARGDIARVQKIAQRQFCTRG